MTDSNGILDAVKASAGLIRAEAEGSERQRRLTEAVVGALRDAGVFRMAMSRAMGGPELPPLQQIAVIEELAAADAAAGWCGMINCDGGFVTAYLDPVAAKELYPSIDQPTVFVVNPTGTATVEGDGYRVSGQWPFASGSSHAEVFFLNCLVFDASGMRMDGEIPEMRVVGLRRDQVEVLDTWHTTGLAGTASNDVKATEVFVPRTYSYAPFVDRAVDPAALYRWRWLFLAKMPAVPLGAARGAIDEAMSVATTKVTMPSFALAREDATVQSNIGRATALVRSARAYVDDTIGTVWDAMCAGREPTAEEWVDARLAITMAFTNSKEAVSLLYEALGTTGVYRKSPLDRQLRDVTTMGQHIVSQTKTYGASGRRLLGLEPGIPGF